MTIKQRKKRVSKRVSLALSPAPDQTGQGVQACMMIMIENLHARSRLFAPVRQPLPSNMLPVIIRSLPFA